MNLTQKVEEQFSNQRKRANGKAELEPVDDNDDKISKQVSSLTVDCHIFYNSCTFSK